MVSNQKLFSVGDFDFRLQHLLVIGILILSFSVSMLIRSTPASYGFELFEFDPFFNFRATEYIVENGHDAYFDWMDEKSWHPFGRNISETSQVSLHIVTASLYPIFNFGLSLYDFTILFPLVIGSLTSILVFAFVRVIGGTTAGLFAALIFSVSIPIFSRGLIGWFKSEPLGLFFAFLAMYLFISGMKFNKGKISIIKLIAAGLFLALGISSWGGILFFVLAIAIFYFAIPFIKHEKNFYIVAAPVFSVSLTIFSLMFERTSAYIIGYAGIVILLPTAYVIMAEFIKKFSSESSKFRNCSILLFSIILSGIGIFSSGLVALPTFRFLNAINPFLTSTDSLTDSVAEHMTTDMTLSFTLLSVFIIFAVIGGWALFSKKLALVKSDMRIFALITSIIAIYVSSAFVRLELFASIGVIILGSIGLSILVRKTFQQENKLFVKIFFTFVISGLFIIPSFMPEGNSTLDWADFPPSILNGGSQYSKFTSNDWKESMEWLKNNTHEDAVIASWWDYGYWITTLSDRTTLIDNSTLIDWHMKKMAYVLITSPENSWTILNSHYTEDVSEFFGNDNLADWGSYYEDGQLEREAIIYKDCQAISLTDAKKQGVSPVVCEPIKKGLDSDYILIYLVGERFYVNESPIPLYTLEGGGDESKKSWFVKVSNHDVSKFIQSDNITPTSYFMENSTLGQLMPFSIIKYVEPNTGRTFDQYRHGFIPVYVQDIKMSDPENDPFFLVYSSPSFYSQQPGIMSAVLIYKINPDYTP